jgi:hypothetical protein
MSHLHDKLTMADELHAVRLLAIEQKPFQRVFKRLTQSDSAILKRNQHLPTPPPDAEDANEEAEAENVKDKAAEAEKEVDQWRQDMKLDFAALESSMVRIQLLQRSNERERDRYAAEKIKIMETAEKIRRSNIELKQQLELARQTMESRKKYDELANKIFSNKLLKSREEQMQMHEKLQKEITEQEQEAEEHAKAVAARREQWFGAIKGALKDMKGIQHPELQQQDEEMKTVDAEGEGEEEHEDSGREGSRAPSRSRSASLAREHTPAPHENSDEAGVEGGEILKVPPRSRGASQAASPAPETQGTKEDIDMTEEAATTPLESVEEGEASDSNDLMED